MSQDGIVNYFYKMITGVDTAKMGAPTAPESERSKEMQSKGSSRYSGKRYGDRYD